MTGPGEQAETERAPTSIAESAARHKVRLSVYRDFGPDERWQERPVGFEIELRGTVYREGPRFTEHGIRAAYDVLRGIAEWAFGCLEADPRIAYEFDGYHTHVILADPLPEVELHSHIYHRDDRNRPLDDDDRSALDQVRYRLRAAGVHG
jgi:hypothetical protein